MRKCSSCQTLHDNGAYFCEKCGDNFKYDPKITPFSEKRIAIILILLTVIGVIIFKRQINKPITNNECSRLNYLKVEKIIKETRNNVMRVQDHGYIPLAGGTNIMREKYKMEEILLPSCFEPIRSDMIEYITLMHRVTRISSFGGHSYTSGLLEEAYKAQEKVNATMKKIDACIPNCPGASTSLNP